MTAAQTHMAHLDALTTSPALVGPRLVVLPTKAWIAELGAELAAVGFSTDRANLAARAMLRRILERHGWPESAYALAPAAALGEADEG
jgi:hypothetical protein